MNKVIAIAAASAFVGFAAVSTAGAVPVAKPVHDSAVQTVDYYGHHHRGHHRYRHYYGGGPSVGIILGDGQSRCQKWKNICGDRWGWRTRNFFRCLDEHDAC